MIRWYPMARATSRLGGRPVLFDFTRLRYLTGVVPDFQPIVRDIETIRRTLRRKSFGTRVSASLDFKVVHSRSVNSAARFYELSESNLLRSPNDFSAPPWTANVCTVARSAERDPVGDLNAWRVTDATPSGNGNVLQTTLEGGPSARLRYFFRADAPHPTSAQCHGVTANAQAETYWKAGSIIQAGLSTPASGFAAVFGVFAWADVAPQGDVDLFMPDVRSIVVLPGTDEQVLADFKDKLNSDDWSVELSLDAGLTWRLVLLEEHRKDRLEEKWVGHAESFALVAAEVIQRVPPLLDGRW